MPGLTRVETKGIAGNAKCRWVLAQRGWQRRMDGGEPARMHVCYRSNSSLRRRDGREGDILDPQRQHRLSPQALDHHHQHQHVRFDPPAAAARKG